MALGLKIFLFEIIINQSFFLWLKKDCIFRWDSIDHLHFLITLKDVLKRITWWNIALKPFHAPYFDLAIPKTQLHLYSIT